MEGIPAITDIPGVSFSVWHVLIAVLRDDQIVHVEVTLPSIWRSMSCKRESGKAEGRKLTCRGLIFLPPYVAETLINVEGKITELSMLLFPPMYI